MMKKIGQIEWELVVMFVLAVAFWVAMAVALWRAVA